MKALIVSYLFLVIGLLLAMHINPTVSTANKNPRFAEMLRGKQPSPPPPSSSKLNHQGTPPTSTKRPTPPPPPPCPPMPRLHFTPLHFMDRRPPPPPRPY
ncbi:hypothetical protein ACP275_08G222500 [Erythranthe tilingii]